MTWFPQELSHEWFGTLAVVALIWTVLLVFHMNRAWTTFVSLGQRLRYLALLYGSALAVVASVEQYQLNRDVEIRNLGTGGFLLLLGVTIYVTYREEAARRRASLPEKKRASR